MDSVEIIHMNGRGYDYNLGRFLSVDPFIVDPGNSQAINPYSYIMNNPLSGTDPSGYVAEKKEFKIQVKQKAKTGSRVGKNTTVTATVDSNGSVTISGGTAGARLDAANALIGAANKRDIGSNVNKPQVEVADAGKANFQLSPMPELQPVTPGQTVVPNVKESPITPENKPSSNPGKLMVGKGLAGGIGAALHSPTLNDGEKEDLEAADSLSRQFDGLVQNFRQPTKNEEGKKIYFHYTSLEGLNQITTDGVIIKPKANSGGKVYLTEWALDPNSAAQALFMGVRKGSAASHMLALPCERDPL